MKGGLSGSIGVLELRVSWEGMGGWSKGIGGAFVDKEVGWIRGRGEEDLETKRGGGGN